MTFSIVCGPSSIVIYLNSYRKPHGHKGQCGFFWDFAGPVW